jgi:hypothetical protein
LTGEGQELPCSAYDQTTLGFSDHGHGTTTSELKEPFISQDVHGSKHRVLVHPQHGGNVPGQWEPIAWSSFALCDGPPNFGSHLIV